MAKDRLFKVISVLALLISLVFAFLFLSTRVPEISNIAYSINILTLPELSIVGFVKVNVTADVIGNTGVITLTGGCFELTANTESSQADSIQRGLSKKIVGRPVSHDLIHDAFSSLGVEVVMEKILNIDLNTRSYIGRLIIKQGNSVASLDSRPSDGIAIAVRSNAPIYINETLLKENGKNICK